MSVPTQGAVCQIWLIDVANEDFFFSYNIFKIAHTPHSQRKYQGRFLIYWLINRELIWNDAGGRGHEGDLEPPGIEVSGLRKKLVRQFN